MVLNAAIGNRRLRLVCALAAATLSIAVAFGQPSLDSERPLLNAPPTFPTAEFPYLELSNSSLLPDSLDGPSPGGLFDNFITEGPARFTPYWSDNDSVPTPNFLLRPSERQRYALVVELSRNRLFVFENRRGGFVLVQQFYASIGKQGARKEREGDERTPVGVYFLTRRVEDRDLPAYYGAGALPINYPNEWDLRKGRTGYGIWLHGVPRDAYDRGPRSTNGCIAVSNDALSALWYRLEPVVTPVVIAEHIEWVARDEIAARGDELLTAVGTWQRDRASPDKSRYARHYAQDFRSGRTGRSAWLERWSQSAAGDGYAEVRLSQLSAFEYPGESDLVVVTFVQKHRSENSYSSARVRQYWRREEDGVWRIVYEGEARFLPIHERGIPQPHEHVVAADQGALEANHRLVKP